MTTARTLDAAGGIDLGRSRAGHVPGEVGIWLFVLSDMLLEFGTIFGCYLYYRAGEPELFAQSRALLNTSLGLLNTLILLTSSMFVALGVQALRANNRVAAARMFVWGRAMGFGFVGVKVIEYGTKVSAGLTATTNHFFMYYYSATGLHLAHVLIGIVVLTYIIDGARQPQPRPHELRSAEIGATFWHMVDLIWIVLFPLLYLVA